MFFEIDDCAIRRVWGNPDKCPEIAQLFLGVFSKKGKQMNRTHEFYPMITSTVKTIFSLTSPSDESVLVHCLLRYPLISYSEEMLERNKMLSALIQELNRQYTRWNKGGTNGK